LRKFVKKITLLGLIALAAGAASPTFAAASSPVTAVVGATAESLRGPQSGWAQQFAGVYGVQAGGALLGVTVDHYRRYGAQAQDVLATLDAAGSGGLGGTLTLGASRGADYLPKSTLGLAGHLPLPGAYVLNLGATAEHYVGQDVYPLQASVDWYVANNVFTAGLDDYVAPGIPCAQSAWVQAVWALRSRAQLQARVGYGSDVETVTPGRVAKSTGVSGFVQYRWHVTQAWSVGVTLAHDSGLDARNALTVVLERAF
jgi:YaiO family outer membrane protein